MASTTIDDRDTHVTRFSDSSVFDVICVLCGAEDGSSAGIARLRARCPVGGSFRHDSHSIVYDYGKTFGKKTPKYPIRCGLCAKSDVIDLQGPCSVRMRFEKPAVCEEVGTAVPEDEKMNTSDLNGKTVSDPISVDDFLAAVRKEFEGKEVDNRALEKQQEDARAKARFEAKTLQSDGARGHPGHLNVVATPYGDVAGTYEAIQYIRELIDTDTAPKSTDFTLRGEVSALLNRHSVDAKTKTPDFVLADLVLAFLSNMEAAMKARDDWRGDDVNQILTDTVEEDHH